MKPKIGIIHYSYPPIIGGVEVVVRQQAHLFADHDYPVTVLVGEGKVDRNDITLIEIPEIKSVKNIDKQLYDAILNNHEFPAGFYTLSEAIYEKLKVNLQNIDIVIVHNMLTLKFNVPFNHAFKRFVEANPEKKYIAWTHDVSLNPEKGKNIFVNNALEDFIYKPIPQVFYIGISDFLKKTMESIISFPKDIVHVIPNGIPINEFLNLHTKTNNLIIKYHLFETDALIFLPSKITRHKNIDVALKVLDELKKIHLSPKMVITARESHHTKSNEYVGEIVSMIQELGLQDNVVILQDEMAEDQSDNFEIVKDFYKICDVVLFLSRYENFGLPILEAGITKTPIICNDLEVFHEISADNIYFTNVALPPSEIAVFINSVLKKHKTTNLFQEIKKKYNLESLFQNEFLPLIDKIMK